MVLYFKFGVRYSHHNLCSLIQNFEYTSSKTCFEDSLHLLVLAIEPISFVLWTLMKMQTFNRSSHISIMNFHATPNWCVTSKVFTKNQRFKYIAYMYYIHTLATTNIRRIFTATSNSFPISAADTSTFSNKMRNVIQHWTLWCYSVPFLVSTR